MGAVFQFSKSTFYNTVNYTVDYFMKKNLLFFPSLKQIFANIAKINIFAIRK